MNLENTIVTVPVVAGLDDFRINVGEMHYSNSLQKATEGKNTDHGRLFEDTDP